MDLSDGLFVLARNWEALAVFLITILGLGSGVMRAAGSLGGKALPARILLVLPLGALALTWAALCLTLLGRLWPAIMLSGSRVILILGALLMARDAWLCRIPLGEILRSRRAWMVAGLLGLFCLLRLGFIADLLLPPYADSPAHYAIVQDLLSPASAPKAFYSLGSITTHYYHFGFHAVAAWLSLASGLEVPQTIELLGQLFLMIAPLSVAFLAYCATQNPTASLTAGALTAFAWRMPYFAANWGKYPALTGLVLFPALLGLWILHWREVSPPSMTGFVTILASLALAILHTRLIICLFLAGVSFGLFAHLKQSPRLRLREASALAFIPLFALLLMWKPALRVFYTNGYSLPLAVVGLLLPFALLSSARYSLTTAGFVFLLWLTSHVPLPLAEGRATLLDGPFVQTILYIPLALIGGLGFAGLVKKLNDWRPAIWTSAAGLAAVIMIGFISAGNLRPDVCCNYVHPGDLEAFAWIESQTPRDSVVWIAGLKTRRYMIGTDAGIWVRPLTGRNVNLLRYDFDWGSASAFDQICRPYYRDVWVYQGGLPASFDEAGLSSRNWLAAAFESGRARVYRASCNSER
jgi:hypothetical protein